ncbi:response regulator [Pseudomonas citronellolis]|uniref:response regulator n=1 Tax=Pseudomonas citronellolis TaxID=53408 RepID=UPI0023E40878|nr:response regulator [Pseudomonas citronellolis]MDF3934746.1 response regulator [Pseudomonas citronellolis]
MWSAAVSGRAAARHQQHAQADLQALQRHIEASRRGPARVDLILTDYRLGDNLDGEDAVQRIRRYLARPVPALIITGDTSPERIREADTSGNRLLHKPLDTEQLREAIAASQS